MMIKLSRSRCEKFIASVVKWERTVTAAARSQDNDKDAFGFSRSNL